MSLLRSVIRGQITLSFKPAVGRSVLIHMNALYLSARVGLPSLLSILDAVNRRKRVGEGVEKKKEAVTNGNESLCIAVAK